MPKEKDWAKANTDKGVEATATIEEAEALRQTAILFDTDDSGSETEDEFETLRDRSKTKATKQTELDRALQEDVCQLMSEVQVKEPPKGNRAPQSVQVATKDLREQVVAQCTRYEHDGRRMSDTAVHLFGLVMNERLISLRTHVTKTMGLDDEDFILSIVGKPHQPWDTPSLWDIVQGK